MEQRELVSRFKRDGLFDSKRREWFERFETDDASHRELGELIEKVIKLKIKKDPDLLTKNKSKVSALIQTELVKRQVEKAKLERESKPAPAVPYGSGLACGPESEPECESDLLDQINEILHRCAQSIGESCPVSLDGPTAGPPV